MKKRGRGSVSRNWRNFQRRKTDLEWKKRVAERQHKYNIKHRKKITEQGRGRLRKLSEFKNNFCIVCNKLLDYRTKGEFCRKHVSSKAKIKK